MGAFSYLLAAFLPAILYLCLIYTQTSNHVNIRKALIFPFFGMCSILLTVGLYRIFPEADPVVVYDFFGNILHTPTSFDYWWFHTSHVGFIEEISKFTMFFLGLSLLRNKKSNTLYSYMFYAVIVGALFGMCENFQYFTNFSTIFTEDQMSSLILKRSLGSVLLHMITCMFVGYAYALSTVKKKLLPKILTVGTGFGFAVLFHGFFNYHLYGIGVNDYLFGIMAPQTIFIILSGAGLCYLMAKNLIMRDKEKEKQYSLGESIRKFFIG